MSISWSFPVTVSDMLARVAFRAATAARSVQPRVWNTVASTLAQQCLGVEDAPPCSLMAAVCALAIPQADCCLTKAHCSNWRFLYAAMSTEAPKIDPEEGHIHGEREGLTGA